MSRTIDFEYIARLHDEYMNVFLDSQMLIADRLKYAGELPKVLGNFERLHAEIKDIYIEIMKAFDDGCLGACCADGGQRACHLIAALDRLEALEVKEP